MKITRCDGCGTEVEQHGMSRFDGWGGLYIQKRVERPYNEGIVKEGKTTYWATEKFGYELCPDCLKLVENLLQGDNANA